MLPYNLLHITLSPSHEVHYFHYRSKRCVENSTDNIRFRRYDYFYDIYILYILTNNIIMVVVRNSPRIIVHYNGEDCFHENHYFYESLLLIKTGGTME